MILSNLSLYVYLFFDFSLCSQDYKEVVTKARQYYDDEMSGTKKIPKTLKEIVYAIVTRQMNDTEIKDRIRKYVDTDDEAEKSKIQFSFPHVQHESQIKAVIDLSLSVSVFNYLLD